ncbi:MAG: ribbon-helix-helix protein, CopG family [Gemmatimonadota bacterium]
MTSRIHIVVDEEDKERFRRQAEREGKSLSEWLREAARARLSDRRSAGLNTAEELRAFFEACDDREAAPEPDWEEHRRAIERSVRSGAADG